MAIGDRRPGERQREGIRVTSTAAPAGWLPDPHDSKNVRYWDGEAWTQHVETRVAVAHRPTQASEGFVERNLMRILGALGLICGGGGLSLLTFLNAQAEGGSYFVFWGPVAVGLIWLYRIVMDYMRAT